MTDVSLVLLIDIIYRSTEPAVQFLQRNWFFSEQGRVVRRTASEREGVRRWGASCKAMVTNKLLPAIRLLERRARYLFYTVCLFVFLDNPRADSRQSLHAGVLWFRMCHLPFCGLAAPGGRKRGEMKILLLWKSVGNFCILAVFERYLSNAWTDGSTPNFIYVGTMSADVPPPLVGSIGPWEREEGELKTQKIGGGLIRA